jgi:hypothetical protein
LRRDSEFSAICSAVGFCIFGSGGGFLCFGFYLLLTENNNGPRNFKCRPGVGRKD